MSSTYGMDKIIIPSSITFERSMLSKKYRWKSDIKRETIYRIVSKRAFVRFSCARFARELSSLPLEERKVNVFFTDNKTVEIKRNREGAISLQGYNGKHPYVQFIVNKAISKDLKANFDLISKDKTSLTIPINLKLDIRNWSSILDPEDFLISVERDAKSLMKKAIQKKMQINVASKGRAYDLCLIRPDKKEIVIAISSHVAKSQNRSREKRIQKILMDIGKMLPYIWKKEHIIPVIISQPINSKESWSYSTKNYLEFYKREFGFRFITTDFKKGWENDIVKELCKL